MADQADRLRALAKGFKAPVAGEPGREDPPAAPARRVPAPRDAPAAGRARVLTVASGKGGVGKTSLAVNLSLQLCRLGRRVVLFDADLGLANADLLLGLQPRHHLGHVLDGERSLDEAICEGPLGLKLVASGSGIARLADLDEAGRDRVLGQFALLEDRADFLVCDAGAGISRSVLDFALASDEVLVVTTPEPTARLDAYGLIKVLAQAGYEGRVRLAVNMSDGPEEAAETARLLETLAGRFLGLPVESLGAVPRDREVPRCVRAQKPFSLERPDSPASRAVAAMAQELAGVRLGVAPSGGGILAFLERLAGLRRGRTAHS